MSRPAFIHLRVQSAFSLLQGAMHPGDIAKLCVRHRMPAVGIADRNNLFGAMEACDKLTDSGVQPIIGCLLSVLRPGAAKPTERIDQRLDSLVVYAATPKGYENLIRLVSRSHVGVEGADPVHATFSDLAEFSEGLIALTGGCEGAVGRLAAQGQIDQARQYLTVLKDIFGDRLYVELTRTGDANEDISEPVLIDLAYALDIPLVATNPVLFASPSDFEANDILACINQSTVIHDPQRAVLNPELWFKSPKQMAELFADIPEAVANTIIIAQRCAVRTPKRDPILPKFAIGQEEDEALTQNANDGLLQRLSDFVFTQDDSEEERRAKIRLYQDRLDFELATIIRMNFPGYFLIVADFISWAKENGIPVGPGRGSGAGSLVAWSLGITDLDPIRFGLLFERFLNPDRVSMPDFDIDFCETRREEVIHYVQQRYGADHVAQIITFGKMKARAVLKDVGRAMQMPYGQMDRLAKMIPNHPAANMTLGKALDEVAELRAERKKDVDVARVLDIAVQLEGLYRHASTHAAGVVIGDRPLDQLVPLYRDPKSDMAVTQFDMKYVEKAGLVKFDFLGLKTLSVLQRAVELLANRGVKIDLLKLPLDDVKSYDLMQRGETVGVFQLEGEGMRRTLSLVKPTRFEDIIALVALYRPGPMDNIPSFALRKNGRETIDYPHPLLEVVLSETYGIPVYQEQVMQMAQVLANYSLGEADLLRRAMGKKVQAEMDAQTERFVSGCKEKDITESRARDIFQLIDKFAGYGFNKSHAAAYALIAYQTAYLKANYPVEFYAASMAYDISNTDKLAIFAEDMKRFGVPLLGPDINSSGADFTVEKMKDGALAVRYALGALKGVGEKAMAQIVEDRTANGTIRSLSDLASRLDPKSINKRQLESLASAGAFDAIAKGRASAYAAVDQLIMHAAAAAAARDSSQVSLFGDSRGGSNIEILVPKTAAWSPEKQLGMERDAMGFYLSDHPLDQFAHVLKANRVIQSGALASIPQPSDGKGSATLAGLPEEVFSRPGRDGGRGFTMFVLSDQSGSYRLGCFDEAMINQARAAVADKVPVMVRAELVWKNGDETPRLNARAILPLAQVAASTPAQLEIWLRDASVLPDIKEILDTKGRGSGVVKLHLMLDGAANADAVLLLPQRYGVDQSLRAALRGLAGVSDVTLAG
jgi:DNA polymerase III subunit alpha